MNERYKRTSVAGACVLAAVSVFGPCAAQALAQSPKTPPAKKTRSQAKPTESPKKPGRVSTKRPPRGKPGQAKDPKAKIDPGMQRRLDDILRARTQTQRDQARKIAAQRNTGAKPGAAAKPAAARAQTPAPRQPAPKTAPPTPARRTTTPARSRPTPARRSRSAAGRRVGRSEPASPSTVLDIAPIEVEIPPEEKTYWFSCKDCTYQQLVEGFARQTGLGVMGQTPKDGKVNFVSTEALSFNEALSRVRMILFNYKPLEPYWLDRRDTHLEVNKVNDLYRKIPVERMFRSVEEYRAADLPDDELAFVIYTPKEGSLADQNIVRDFLPDYMRVTPKDGTSAIIFALASDINKYLDLVTRLVTDGADPRIIEVFELEHVLPSGALTQIQTLMGSAGAVAQSGRRMPKGIRMPSPLDNMREPDAVYLPDDARGTLLVRAMRDRIEKIRALLPYIDIEQGKDRRDPVTIPVAGRSVTGLIDTIQMILTQSGAGARAAVPKGPTRRPAKKAIGKSVAAPARPVRAAGITMLPHPTQDAILVFSDEEGVARVRELVAEFDNDDQVGPVRIALQYTTTQQMQSTIKAVFMPGGKGRTEARFQLLPGPTGDALWFTGSQRDFDRVRELVAIFDAAIDGVNLHIHPLEHTKPSFVANILRGFDKGAPASADGKGVKRARARPAPAQKFTANDDEGFLFVLCTDNEWEVYLPIINEMDTIAADQPPFSRLMLEHIDPEPAIAALSAFFAEGRGATLRFSPSDGGLLVFGATPSVLDDLKLFLSEIDKPTSVVQRTFHIRHRAPSEIKLVIEAFVGNNSSAKPKARKPRKPRGGLAPPTLLPQLTIVELEDRLVVRTTPEKMERVAELVEEFDVPEVQTELKVYGDFAPGTDIEKLAETLAATLSGGPSGRPSKGPVKGGGPDGPRFIPQPGAGELLVIASPEKYPEIERLLNVLRKAGEPDPWVVEFIEVAHADPDGIVTLVGPLLDVAARQFVGDGRLKQVVGTAATPKKRAQRTGQVVFSGDYYHLAADGQNNQVVVSAPQQLVDEAVRLVARFDRSGEADGSIYRTVELANASPADLVKSIKEMIGANARIKNRGKAGRTASRAGGTIEGLTIVAVPGAQAVFLQGPSDAVEQATEWITELDGAAVSGHALRVYQIVHADIKQLADLILHTVDTPSTTGPKRAPRPRRPSQDSTDDAWETNKTWTGQSIYIQADLIAGTMIVAASEAKLTEVDAIVAQFDDEEAPGVKKVHLPSFVYDLKYADAWDAAFMLESRLEQTWDDPDQVPEVESAFFGNALVIRHPDEERFPEIRRIIAEHIDVLSEEDRKKVKKTFPLKEGINAEYAAKFFEENLAGVEVDIKSGSKGKPDEHGMERVRPPKRRGSNKTVLPQALLHMADNAATTLPGQTAGDTDNIDNAAQPPVKRTDSKQRSDRNQRQSTSKTGSRNPLQEAAKSLLGMGRKDDAKGPPGEGDSRSELRIPPGELLKIRYNNETRSVTVEGTNAVVDHLQDLVEELEEQSREVYSPPDIRIYRARFIDVNVAAGIIGEMFNASRQQRQQIAAAQRQAQQQAQRQAQANARRQQQAQQQAGRGQRPNPRGQQPPQPAAPQLPPTSVRITPNPRDRTLIFRADAAVYPAILELLATIDQPQPIENEFRMFPLKKLNAVQVETLLKDMLGLGATTRRVTPAAGGAAGNRGQARRATSATNGSLPRTILQNITTGPGQLGLNPADIKLSSNEQTNTIIAMAPQAALDFIADVINQLESEDIPDRITRYYDLKHADAGEVTDYLVSHFSETSSGGKKGTPRGGSALGTPSVVPFTSLNLVTVQATEEELRDVDDIVARLDQPAADDDWQTANLINLDAKTTADTLKTMFGLSASMGSRGKAKSGSPEFVGDPGTHVLFYRAAESLHQPILDAIAKLEADALERTTLRVIDLENALPSRIAEAIESAYGSAPRRGGGGANPPFTLSAHDSGKKLFVMSNNVMYAKIESLARSLDRPEALGFEFRIYPLQYANARRVHELLNKLVTNYMRQVGSRGEIEAFSVEVDDEANALVVLGGDTVFKFLEDNLPKIDNPAAAFASPGFFMVHLEQANAVEVAQSIARLWSERTLPPGVDPPQAEANRTLNTLIVRGTPKQIKEIREEFIGPLEAQTAAALLTETISLKFARADTVADSINQIFEAKRRAYKEMGQGQNISPLQFTAFVTPDASTNQVVVQAGEENMALIKARISEIDRADVARAASTSMKIYPIRFAELSSVVAIIHNWARSRPERLGVTDEVIATAEPATQSVVVNAAESSHLIIQDMIDQLDSDQAADRKPKVERFVVTGDPGRVQDAVNQLYRGARNPRDQVMAIADFVGNAVIVQASAENLPRVAELIASLDSAEGDELDVHVVNLENADAQAVAQTLTEIFIRSRPTRKGNQVPPVSISAMQGAKSLLIKANEADFSEMEGIIAQLDSSEAVMPETVRVVSLLFTDASEMQGALETSLRKPGGGRNNELAGDVRLSVLSQSNALVVSGSTDEVDRVEKTIQMLDVAGEPGNAPTAIVLTHANAGEIVPILQEMFSQSTTRGRGKSAPVIVGDDGTNTILVRADPTDLEAIKATVALLDTDEEKVPGYRLVSISPGLNVTTLADQVEETINSGARGTGRRGREIATLSVRADTRSHSVILSGNPSQFDDAEKLIRALEETGPSGGKGVRFIKLGKISGAEIQSIIAQLQGDQAGSTGARGGRGADRRRNTGRRQNAPPRRGQTGGRRRNQRRPGR